MKKILLLLFFSLQLEAATYTFPDDLPGLGCSLFFGTTYQCVVPLNFGNNDTINVVSSISITNGSNFTAGNGLTINTSGNILSLTLGGIFDVGQNLSATSCVNVEAGGDIDIGNNGTINGILQSNSGTVTLGNNTNNTPCSVTNAPPITANWKLDECSWNGSTSEVIDSGSNAYHGTSLNSDTNVEAQMCRSGDFTANGISDYVILDEKSLDGLDDFSMSVWIKTSNSSNQAVISGANSSSNNEALMWFSDGTTFTPHIKGRRKNININNIADNIWHHFVWTRSSLENCAYVDGTLQACTNINNSSGIVQIDAGGLILAQEQDSVGGSFSSSQDFEGLIDELKIYDGKLELSDVQTIYNNENSQKNYDGTARVCQVCIKIPSANYHFDECFWDGTPTEVFDSSLNSFNARSINGANTVSQAQIERSGFFDGVDDFVEQDNIFDILKTTSSLSFWIKTTQNGDNTSWRAPGVIGIEEAGGGDDIFWGWIDASGNIGFTKGNTNRTKSTTEINDNIWHHVVLTWNAINGFSEVYVDGILEDTGTTETGDVGNNFNRIGSIQDTGGSPTFFNGYLDEVLMYSSILNASEVKAIYDNQFLGKNYDGTVRVPIDCSTRLLAEYKMDECLWDGSPSEILDTSGNNYHAKAKNGAQIELAINSGGGICGGGKFDGINDYLEIGQFPDVVEDFSITAWFKTEDNTERGQRVFADDETSTNGYAVSVGDGGTGRVRFYDRSQSGAGIIDTSNIIQNNTWYFVTAVNDKVNSIRHLYVYNTSGVQLDHVTRAINANRGNNTGLASMGGETDSGETNNRLFGNVDEVKVFTKALSQGELENILNNERINLNWDGTGRTCPSCNVFIPKDGNYTAVDLVTASCSAATHWDNMLKTKIVNANIDLSILSLDKLSNLPLEANITRVSLVHYPSGNNNACSGSVIESVEVCTNCGLTDVNGCLSLSIDKSLNQRASQCVEILIEGKDKDDTAGISLSDSNSSDNLSIRPNTYNCDGIVPSTLVSERNYLSTLKAMPLNLTSSTIGYTTTSVNISAKKYMRTGDLNLSLNGSISSSGLNFVDGNTSIDLSFNDVGDIGIDVNDSVWANVDSDDTPEIDRIIHAECRRLFRADHFEVILSRPFLENNATGFTYLSNLSPSLRMSAWMKGLDVTITAKGENNATMLNYKSPNTDFYANDVFLSPFVSFPAKHSSATKYPDLMDQNSSDILDFIFVDGVASYSYENLGFNYDRDFSSAIIPFSVNGNESLFSLSASDKLYPSVNGNESTSSDNNVSFFYGRLHTKDLITTRLPSNANGVYEVYDNINSAFTAGMNQSSLFWYINNLHNAQNEGSVILATASSDTLIDNTLAGFSYTYNTPSLGRENLGINTASTSKATLHLNTQKWLWYVPLGFGSAYDYGAGSDCTMHPCLKFSLVSNNTALKVESGDFNGTVVPDVNRSEYIQKGVKLFR